MRVIDPARAPLILPGVPDIFNGRPSIFRRAQLRVIQPVHQLVVDYLRVGHRLFGSQGDVARHVCRLQVGNPVGRRSRPHHARHRVEDPLPRLFVFYGARSPLDLGVRRDHLRQSQNRRRALHETGVYATKLHPAPIRALVNAVERTSALRIERCRVAMPVRGVPNDRLGHVQQRARHQRGLNASAATGSLPPEQRRYDARRRQQSRADVRQRMHDVDRFSVQPRQHSHPGRNEVVISRFVPERPVSAVSRDRAVNDARTPTCQTIQPQLVAKI